MEGKYKDRLSHVVFFSFIWKGETPKKLESLTEDASENTRDYICHSLALPKGG